MSKPALAESVYGYDRNWALLQAVETQRQAAMAARQQQRILRLLLLGTSRCPDPISRKKEPFLMKSYYKVLGVGPVAEFADIRRAYRTLVRTHHPDRVGGDRQRFLEIQEAYEVLSEEARRRAYDAQRAEWLASQGALDCSHCGTPNRIPFRGAATRCGACKTALTEETAEGRLKREGLKALEDASRIAQGLVGAVLKEASQAADRRVETGFDRLRNKLHRRGSR